MTDCTQALDELVGRMNTHMQNYYKNNSVECPDMWISRGTYTTKEGTKFVKIVREGAVVAFIEKATGNIFKPATWKAPAKGVRGNLFSGQKGDEAMQYECYGIVFVRYARG